MQLSRTTKFAIPAVVGILTLGLFTTSALAATTSVSTTFTVSANVVASCTISAGALGFGAYTGTAVSSTSTITVTCTNKTPYNVGLNAGTGAGATVTSRVMTGTTSSANTLAYSLTANSVSGPNWGVTVGTDTVGGTGSGSAQSLIVYGQIAAGQNVPADTYKDTITASVIY
jgi:spore coat protein U-like protein